jgi:type III secretion protein L
MYLAARLKDGGLRLLPERRVVKAAEIAALADARGIVEDAGMEAERIREAAHQAYLDEKQRGYAEGVASGEAKIALELADLAAQGARFVDRLEAQMPDIISDAVRQILGTFDKSDLVVRTANQALRMFRKETAVSVKVAPSQLETVRARIDELKQGNESITYVDVVADPRLTDDGCIVASEFGSVDASIEAQLAVLDRAIKTQLAGGGG